MHDGFPVLISHILIQELGGCGLGDKCHWAHGPEDLDTRAFKFDFPQRQDAGGWEGVGAKRPARAQAQAQNGNQQATWQNGGGQSAWGNNQHMR